jgi:hypothetical protein
MKARLQGLAALTLVSMGIWTMGSGCVSSRVVHRDQLRPGDAFARSVVFLQGGAKYEFLRLGVFPDTVVGEYAITVERGSKKEGVYYEDEIHAHRMALAAVDSVAVLRRDSVKTLLYAAGAVGGGLLIYEAIESGSPAKGGSSNFNPGGPSR